MSKLKVLALVTLIAWAGFGSSQTATAVEFSAQAMTTPHPRAVVTDVRSRSVSGREYFALAKRCTIKRYRRPH
jgi:hypothetical protein